MTTNKALTYEEAIAELDLLIAKLDRDQIPLNELFVTMQKAKELIAFCEDILRNTEASAASFEW